MFSGEAYNVEQGVTNDLFPVERDETPGARSMLCRKTARIPTPRAFWHP